MCPGRNILGCCCHLASQLDTKNVLVKLLEVMQGLKYFYVTLVNGFRLNAGLKFLFGTCFTTGGLMSRTAQQVGSSTEDSQKITKNNRR